MLMKPFSKSATSLQETPLISNLLPAAFRHLSNQTASHSLTTICSVVCAAPGRPGGLALFPFVHKANEVVPLYSHDLK